MSISVKVKKQWKREYNKEVPLCKFCHEPLVRVFGEGGEVRCNHCNELLTRKADSSGRKYVPCPYCSYEGEELISPSHNTKCPKCGRLVLQTEVNRDSKWFHGNYKR